MFRSTNNGTDWTAVNTGLTDPLVYAFAVIGSNLFAGTHDGVFFSTNNGSSWTDISTGLTTRSVLSLVVNDSHLFAGTSRNGVWRRPLSEIITAVEEDFSEVPVGFALKQNYPNPFNPNLLCVALVTKRDAQSLRSHRQRSRHAAAERAQASRLTRSDFRCQTSSQRSVSLSRDCRRFCSHAQNVARSLAGSGEVRLAQQDFQNLKDRKAQAGLSVTPTTPRGVKCL